MEVALLFQCYQCPPKVLKKIFPSKILYFALLPDSWWQVTLALQEDLVAQALQLLK